MPHGSLRWRGPGMASGLARQQAGGARVDQQPFQAAGLRDRNRASEWRQAIVAAAFVVVLRVRAFVRLLDHFLFEEPPNRRIEAARAQAKRAAGAVEDILHHGVAVALAVGKRDED